MTNTNRDMGRTISERYLDRFGEGLPSMSWYGSAADLLRLMERAIASGHALSTADLYAEQGMEPPRGMKRIIDGKAYATDSSTIVADGSWEDKG